MKWIILLLLVPSMSLAEDIWQQADRDNAATYQYQQNIEQQNEMARMRNDMETQRVAEQNAQMEQQRQMEMERAREVNDTSRAGWGEIR